MYFKEDFFEKLYSYIVEREAGRVLNLIYIFDYEKGDFVSLRNELRANMIDFKEMENETIKVLYTPMPPYINTMEDTNKITGFVGDIWNVFEEFLKFNTELTKTNFSYGTLQILYDDFDVMLTSGVAYTGFRNLKFSQPYFYNWYQLYMQLPSRTPNSTFYIRTLTPTFWYACIVVFLLLTISLRFTVRMFNRVGRKYYGYYLEAPLSLPTCFLTVISGFANQGFDVHVRSYSARAQVIIALVFGYMVYSGMSAVLVSELAVSELQMPVKNLDDVVNKKKWSLCVRPDSFVYETLTDDPRFNHILNGKGCKYDVYNPAQKMKQMLCDSNVVVLESQAIMTSFLMNTKLKCEILTINGKYYRRGNSLLVGANFKFKRIIFLYMEKLRGNGILQKLQNQWVRPMKIEDINPPATIEVTLYHVKGILILYATMVLFSLFVLFIECFINKCNKQKYQYLK